MYKQVIIVRHGKSSWANFTISDHDRPLDERGIKDSPFMANWLSELGFFPQRLITSTAVRAKSTARFFLTNLASHLMKTETYIMDYHKITSTK